MRGSIKKLYLWLKNKHKKVFSTSVYLLVFLYSLHPYVDFDWGWHYRYGEYFFKHLKIYRSDTFSWVLPGYQWVNHSWLFDLLAYQIFHNFGFLGMIVSAALIAVFCFYILLKSSKTNYWQKAILAVFYLYIIFQVFIQGLRSQVFGVLFLSILVTLLFKKQHKKSFFYIFPLFFLLWVNMHGTFTLGLLVFTLFIFGRFLVILLEKKQKEGIYPYLMTFAASVLLTFINPFTYKVYLEAARHLSNPYLRDIIEWQPICFDKGCVSYCIFFLIYSAFLLVGFIVRRKVADIPFILISALFIYQGVIARRNLAFLAVSTLPMAAVILSQFTHKLAKLRITNLLCVLFIIISLEIALFRQIPGNHILNYSFHDYCYFGSSCSTKLVDYLKKHPPQGKGFNFYNWGGFFIGQGVPAKLFMDGRMHLWEKDGYQPFADYAKMYYKRDFELFKKYDFDWVIAYKNSILVEEILSSRGYGEWEEVFVDGNSIYLKKINKVEN